MRHWWVNQNQTWKQESEGGYLWSPTRKSDGSYSRFYENMKEVSPGDVVACFWGSKIQAVGIARSYRFDASKPDEFGEIGSYWRNEAHKVWVTFRRVPKPFRPKEHIKRLKPLLAEKYAPLRSNGDGLQSVYLTEISQDLSGALMDLAGVSASDLVELREKALSASTDVDGEVAVDSLEDGIEDSLKADPTLDQTQRKTLTDARRGQGKFRDNVFNVEKRCRVSGIGAPEHLIASHIKPWRSCETASERLDGNNGLLLVPNADHLFDKGFISFEDNGTLLVAPVADPDVLSKLGIKQPQNVGAFSTEQSTYLDFHRRNILKKRTRD